MTSKLGGRDDRTDVNADRQWRVNAILAFGLGACVLAVLVARPPFPLDRVAVPDGVTVTLESGSTGAQSDGDGIYWWISTPDAAIRLVNNRPEIESVSVTATLVNGPCAESRVVSVAGERIELRSASDVEVVTIDVDLEAYERRAINVVTDGSPCPQTALEPRSLLVRISDLEVVDR